MSVSYERYAALRDSKGMTDYAVAKQSGIGKSTFSDWKNGRSSPKNEKIERIAEVLGVSLLAMLGSEGIQQFELIPEDTFVLLRYKDLNEVGQRKVREYIEDLYDRYKNV
jgi:transcriptional regulator with XRE-family HTH domain